MNVIYTNNQTHHVVHASSYLPIWVHYNAIYSKMKYFENGLLVGPDNPVALASRPVHRRSLCRNGRRVEYELDEPDHRFYMKSCGHSSHTVRWRLPVADLFSDVKQSRSCQTVHQGAHSDDDISCRGDQDDFVLWSNLRPPKLSHIIVLQNQI